MSSETAGPQTPSVSLEDVPFEDRAMLSLALATSVSNGFARTLFWWVMHANAGKPIPYTGAQRLSEVLGCHRSHCHRAIKQLVEAGCVQVIGTGDERHIGVVIPEKFPQELGISWRRFLNECKPSKVLPIKRNKRSREQTIPPASPPEGSQPPEFPPDADVQTNSENGSTPIKAPRTKITAEEVQFICSSFDNIANYLTFGKAKVYEPNKDFPPTSLNWRVNIKNSNEFTTESVGAATWTVPQFVGFYWYRVCTWRSERKVQLGMPPFEKLCGNMKSLLQTMGGNWELLQYIHYLTLKFDLVCLLAGPLGDSMMLDDASAINPILRNKTQYYMSLSDEHKALLHDQYAEQMKQRLLRFTRN